MSSRVRFHITKNYIVSIHIDNIDVGYDLKNWIIGHSHGNFQHMSLIYKIYIKHKFGQLVNVCHGDCNRKVRWNYDIINKSYGIVIRYTDFGHNKVSETIII